MANGPSSLAFTTKTRDHGRREWKCKGECCKNPKFLNAPDKGKWNRASKLECQVCGFLPNKTCPLWGDGLGVNGGKWKVDNHIAPDTQLPSKQTAAGKTASDKRTADNKQFEKMRKDNEALQKKLEVYTLFAPLPLGVGLYDGDRHRDRGDSRQQ